MVFKYFFVWVDGWLEKWGFKLISTQVVVEVEVGVELGNKDQRVLTSELEKPVFC